ncbi:heme-binding protein 2-like [Anolis carolinensis]|uniref:heme-binding protein 2-like n=1 Tax=Anolis carolinensis TaxID=28377 RepID=UPI002F2B1A2A
MLGASSVPVAVFLALVLVGNPGESAERAEPPPCKENRECLNYTVVCHGSGYEGRHYPNSSWVGTRVQDGSKYFSAVVKSFWRLFRYIHLGANERKATIPMTSPVLTRVEEAEGSFEVYFMLPEAFRADPPKPTEETVFLTTSPEMEVYARFFGGWMTDNVQEEQLKSLDEALTRDQRATRPGLHYVAGFNSPFELYNRRNEVWRLAEGDLACPSALQEGPEE